MHSRSLRRFVAVLLFLFLLGAAPPQRPQIPSIGETIEVSIINLDVVVTDRDGKRVRGLKPEDFEILEGKVRQPISNFAEYSSSAEHGSVAVDAPQSVETPPRQQRTVVLFVEQMKLTRFQVEPLVASIRELAQKTIEPGDAISVVLWTPYSDVQLAYTDDPKEIDRALEHITDVTTHQMNDPTKAMREQVLATQAFEAEVAAAAGGGGAGGRDGTAIRVLDASRAGEAAAEINAQVAMVEMKRRVNAINATLNSMAGREGKKVLLLATRRLGEVAGAEFFYTAGARNLSQATKIKYGTVGLVKTIISNANAAGVTIYPIYPPGVATSGPDAGFQPQGRIDTTSETLPDPAIDSLTFINEMASLTDIAKKTGGLTAGNVKEIVSLLPQIEEDIADYYSLAYRVTASRTDRARDVVVKVRNPAYTVRARRQYVEKSDTTKMKDRVLAALFRELDDTAFRITAQFGKPRKQGRRERFPLEIHVPIRELTVVPNGEKNAGAFSVFVATSKNIGRVSEVSEMTQPFEIPSGDMERATSGHFTYVVDVIVDDNADRVAVGVLDEIAKTYAVLRVPIPGRGRDIAAGR